MTFFGPLCVPLLGVAQLSDLLPLEQGLGLLIIFECQK